MNGKTTTYKEAKSTDKENYIIINVSGRRFKTDEKLLGRYPGIDIESELSQREINRLT
jgi:hypothetical protein